MKTLLLAACLAVCFYSYEGDRKPAPRPTPSPLLSPTMKPSPEPTGTARPAVSPSPSRSPSPTRLPCELEGDVTKEILRAIASGQKHSGGGCIRSQLIVDGTFRFSGTYQTIEAILVKSNGSIIGEGWEKSVLIESPIQWVVIAGYNAAPNKGDADQNITLRNLKISGAGVKIGFNSAPQTVSMGNCVDCSVDRVWFDRTHTIAVQYGAFARLGNYAKNSKITNCLFTGVAGQGIAVTNAEDIEISNHAFSSLGQKDGPGNVPIDLETNSEDDRLVRIIVKNNKINGRDSVMPLTGIGIQVSGNISPLVRDILIDGNTITGGFRMTNLIVVAGRHASHVKVTNNKISETVYHGIWLVNGSDILCENNSMTAVGSEGHPGFEARVVNSIIRNNPLTCLPGLPCNSRMVLSGEGNTVEKNPGWTPVKSKTTP